uniref:APOBEC1 complementation factor n=1 Tax=Aceria tosichella TaxID=561515 RepID=A0A6G1S930_9ACAR
MLNEYVNLLETRKAYAQAVLSNYGFDLITQNGQRISTNRAIPDDLISRVEYSEIFIGKLPRDLFEDELLPYLLQVGGTILKIRYMMDFSGSNRGFCFVKFANTEEACRAILMLNGKVLREDSPPIGVKISFDNKVLFFGNLPPNCTAHQLVKSLKKADIGGIVNARMADGPQVRGNHNHHQLHQAPSGVYSGYATNHQQRQFSRPTNRFGYVYFESHDAATKARRLLMPSDIKIMGRKVTLDWAKSEIPEGILPRGVYCSGYGLLGHTGGHWQAFDGLRNDPAILAR